MAPHPYQAVPSVEPLSPTSPSMEKKETILQVPIMEIRHRARTLDKRLRLVYATLFLILAGTAALIVHRQLKKPSYWKSAHSRDRWASPSRWNKVQSQTKDLPVTHRAGGDVVRMVVQPSSRQVQFELDDDQDLFLWSTDGQSSLAVQALIVAEDWAQELGKGFRMDLEEGDLARIHTLTMDGVSKTAMRDLVGACRSGEPMLGMLAFELFDRAKSPLEPSDLQLVEMKVECDLIQESVPFAAASVEEEQFEEEEEIMEEGEDMVADCGTLSEENPAMEAEPINETDSPVSSGEKDKHPHEHHEKHQRHHRYRHHERDEEEQGQQD